MLLMMLDIYSRRLC